MKETSEALARRTPPGQVLTTKWPVLTYGRTPRFDPARWRFRCFGLVEEEASFTWDELVALPRVEVRCDVHCVTHWSRLDNGWEGVPVREVLRRSPEARGPVVLSHADRDYTTNVTLEDLLDDNLFATHHDGQPLSPGPRRTAALVVPQLYFWKGAKWVARLEFLDRERGRLLGGQRVPHARRSVARGALFGSGDTHDAADATRAARALRARANGRAHLASFTHP